MIRVGGIYQQKTLTNFHDQRFFVGIPARKIWFFKVS